jgi:hypothetical protein
MAALMAVGPAVAAVAAVDTVRVARTVAAGSEAAATVDRTVDLAVGLVAAGTEEAKEEARAGAGSKEAAREIARAAGSEEDSRAPAEAASSEEETRAAAAAAGSEEEVREAAAAVGSKEEARARATAADSEEVARAAALAAVAAAVAAVAAAVRAAVRAVGSEEVARAVTRAAAAGEKAVEEMAVSWVMVAVSLVEGDFDHCPSCWRVTVPRTSGAEGQRARTSSRCRFHSQHTNTHRPNSISQWTARLHETRRRDVAMTKVATYGFLLLRCILVRVRPKHAGLNDPRNGNQARWNGAMCVDTVSL